MAMTITTEIAMEFTKQSAPDAVEFPEDLNPGNYSAARLVSLYRPRIAGFLVYFSYVLVALFIYAGWQRRLE